MILSIIQIQINIQINQTDPMDRQFPQVPNNYTFAYPTNTQPNYYQSNNNYTHSNAHNEISDLVIFNERHNQPNYTLYQNNQQSQQNQSSQRLIKATSQKSFPIIYNSYNDGKEHIVSHQTIVRNQVSRQIPVQDNRMTHQSNKYFNNVQNQYKIITNQPNSQEIHFDTFQQIPSDGDPQTAKFLNFPQKKDYHDEYMATSQTQKYRPPQRFDHSQNVQSKSYQHQNISPSTFNISNQNSYLGLNNIQKPISSRPFIHEEQKKIANTQQPRVKLIQITQQQYEQYRNHLPQCIKTKQQNSKLQGQCQQLSEKQHLYWQQNMNLRQQNKRLRDLVSHLQRRQKQLVKSKEQLKDSFQQQVLKYRDSTLQEFNLLMERYKLQSRNAK